MGGRVEEEKQATKTGDEKWSGEMKASVCCRQLLSDRRPPLDCLYCQTLFDFSTAGAAEAPPTVLLGRLTTQTLCRFGFFIYFFFSDSAGKRSGSAPLRGPESSPAEPPAGTFSQGDRTDPASFTAS